MINDDNPLKLADILPESLAGWEAGTTLPLKTATDLYNYIDGGAELYISYGFGEALSRTYTSEGQIQVLAEVYDLLEPRNAFGVFSQTREDEKPQYGQGTYAITGAVFFWKERYYISLSTWEPTPGATGFIHALASFINEKIVAIGSLPDVVQYLIPEGLIPFGYMYFHHPVWLNAYFFISDQNILQIDNTTNALLARYADSDKRQYLLLVQYPDNQSALKAYNSFGEEFFPEGLTDHCIRLEDGTWLAASIHNNLIAAVFNGSTRISSSQLLIKTLDGYKKENSN